MTFYNLKDLTNYIQTQINNTLQDEVAESVKDTMLEAIDRVVYDRYDPSYYERRGDKGGLRDRDNITILGIQNGIIAENTTLVNDDYGAPNTGQLLSPIIVSGQGYLFSGYRKPYEHRRDFVEETRSLLKKHDIVKQALKDGLSKRGLQND